MSTNKQTYLSRFATLSAAVEFENKVLSVARCHLPTCAVAVLEGNDDLDTDAYYKFLLDQFDLGSVDWYG